MSRKSRIYISCAGLLALVLIFLWGAVLPQHHRLKREKDAVKDLIADIEELRVKSDEVVDVEGEIQRIQSRIQAYENKFRPQGDLPKIIQSLSDLFTSNHLKVMAILAKEVVQVRGTDEPLVKNVLSVELEGEFLDFGHMLHDLENHPNAVTVEELEVEKTKADSSRLSIKILLGVFLTKGFPNGG